MTHREPYDPDFDDDVGLTESPDLARAQAAVVVAQAAAPTTDMAIAESRHYISQLREIRNQNHFTQKIRQIFAEGAA